MDVRIINIEQYIMLNITRRKRVYVLLFSSTILQHNYTMLVNNILTKIFHKVYQL